MIALIIMPFIDRINVRYKLLGTYSASPYAGGVQVGSPEPPFKINDIHSMHVVEVCLYIHIFLYKYKSMRVACSVFSDLKKILTSNIAT